MNQRSKLSDKSKTKENSKVSNKLASAKSDDLVAVLQKVNKKLENNIEKRVSNSEVNQADSESDRSNRNLKRRYLYNNLIKVNQETDSKAIKVARRAQKYDEYVDEVQPVRQADSRTSRGARGDARTINSRRFIEEDYYADPNQEASYKPKSSRTRKYSSEAQVDSYAPRRDDRRAMKPAPREIDYYAESGGRKPGTPTSSRSLRGRDEFVDTREKYASPAKKYNTSPRMARMDPPEQQISIPSSSRPVKNSSASRSLGRLLYLETIDNLVDERGNLLAHNETIKYLGNANLDDGAAEPGNNQINPSSADLAQEPQEKKPVDIRSLGRKELEQLAAAILENENKEREKCLKKKVGYYHNNEEIYPNGIIKDVIEQAKER